MVPYAAADPPDLQKAKQPACLAIILSILFYCISVPVIFPLLGGSIVGFIVIPVMIISWHAGMKPGFIVGFLAGLFLNSITLAFLYHEWVWDVLMRHQGIPGVIMLTLLGGGAGYFRELRDRYVRELRQRLAAQKDAEESSKGFQMLFNQSSEGLYLVDPGNGNYIEVNPAMCSITGYNREELIGSPHARLVPTEDRQKMKSMMQRLKQGESISDFEATIIRKDGRTCYVIFGATEIVWQGSRVLYGFLRDITSLKRMQLELERKNREIIDLINTISHDLRNPLTGIKGILELHCFAGEENGENGKEPSLHRLALREVDYMQDLLDDLLEAARLDTGSRAFEWKTVRLNDLFGKVVELFGPQISQRKIAVSLDVADITILTDERAFEKVCMNLLGNAILYMGSQPTPAVTIGARDDGAAVTLRIADNGMGIPAAALPFIFEKFRRGSNVGSIKGTGLGLAIVKGIVKAQGGTIRVESTEGAGSTFILTLPHRHESCTGKNS